MRRRDLLSGLATAAVGATAGCGYAPGAGDLRAEGAVRFATAVGRPEFVVADDRVVGFRSGDLRVGEEGVVRGTELVCATRSGETRWRRRHAPPVREVVTAGGVDYLLDGDDSVVAVDEDGTVVGRLEPERLRGTALAGDALWVATPDDVVALRGGDVAWSASDAGLRGVRFPDVATAGGTAVVATAGELVAVEADRATWRRSGEYGLVDATGDHAYVTDGGALAALDLADGTRRWARGEDYATNASVLERAGTAFVRRLGGLEAHDVDDGRRLWADEAAGDLLETGARTVLVVGDRRVVGVDAADGTRRWRLDGDERVLGTGAGEVFVADDRGLAALDARDGQRLWDLETSLDVETPLVRGERALYVVATGERDCVAAAVDGDGYRWSRTLREEPSDGVEWGSEVVVPGGCDLAATWLDAETVTFLFRSGRLLRFQRRDREPTSL